MSATTHDTALLPNPQSLADAILNLRGLMDTDVIFAPQLFDQSFLATYFPAERFQFFNKNGREDVLIEGFRRFAQNVPGDAKSLHFASLEIGRSISKENAIRVGVNLNLEVQDIAENTITYELLERLMGCNLTVQDPIDSQKYFSTPTNNTKGDHFYSCSVKGLLRSINVMIKLGPFATLQFLGMATEGARQ